jgi:F1F0 ATPase subunit 2
MRETATLTLVLVAGVLLGTLFFVGLQWTTRRGVSSRWPAAWFLGSLSFRTPMALAGFYLVSRHDWRRWFACLLGFLLARAFATRLSSGSTAKGAPRVEGRRI